MSYRCYICGQVHDDLPDIGFEMPDYAHHIPREERSERVELTSDTCVVGGEDFFIRGVLEIPVHDSPEPFGIGVWVSQKEANFRRYVEEFDSDAIGPFFGWLSNEIGFYEEPTLSLKTMAHFRGGTLRPSIVLEPTEHPLSVDQRDGISLERAWEIVHHYLG